MAVTANEEVSMDKVLVILWVLLAGGAAWAGDGEVAGIIKNVSGQAYLIRGGTEQQVADAADMKLAPGDTVRTAGNGSVGLIFRDDSMVALGPDSEFTIEKFQFRPVEGQLSFFGRIVRGTINFISGQITNLAPENVELETPDATLAVRGTQILVEIR